MRTLSEVLAEYGLKAMGSSENRDLKRMLRFKVMEVGKGFEDLKIEMSPQRVPRIIMGGALINRMAFNALMEETQSLRIGNTQTFNQRFDLFEGSRIPAFLLDTVEMKFANNVFEEFVYIKRRDGIYREMVIAEALENQTHPMHDYFIEERLKEVFVPSGESMRKRLFMLLSQKIGSLTESLEKSEGMAELKKDITLFVFDLLKEIAEEEKKKE